MCICKTIINLAVSFKHVIWIIFFVHIKSRLYTRYMSMLLTEVHCGKRKHPIGVWVDPPVHTACSHDIHRCLVTKV